MHRRFLQNWTLYSELIVKRQTSLKIIHIPEELNPECEEVSWNLLLLRELQFSKRKPNLEWPLHWRQFLDGKKHVKGCMTWPAEWKTTRTEKIHTTQMANFAGGVEEDPLQCYCSSANVKCKWGVTGVHGTGTLLCKNSSENPLLSIWPPNPLLNICHEELKTYV